MTKNFDDFNKETEGDSVNLTTIKDTVFTITAVEKSDYTAPDGEVSEGVKITTEETWEKEDSEGNITKVNKLHTTRRAVVSKLNDEDFRKALDGGETFKVKSPLDKVKPKGAGQPYFDLVAAT